MTTRRRRKQHFRAIQAARRLQAKYLPALGGAESGIALLPGFEESVRLLFESERYSISDVALMFGVCRARMQQLSVKLGIGARGRGLHDVRVWDDEANRFRPVARGTITVARKREAAVARELAREHRRAQYRAWMVQETRALAVELGRTPSLPEVAVRLGDAKGRGGWVASMWGCGRSRKGTLAEFWAACGLTPRPRGGAGHLRKACAPVAEAT